MLGLDSRPRESEMRVRGETTFSQGKIGLRGEACVRNIKGERLQRIGFQREKSLEAEWRRAVLPRPGDDLVGQPPKPRDLKPAELHH